MSATTPPDPRTHNLSVREALAALFEALEPGPVATESVEVHAAIGRVLAETLHARWPLPTASASIMDGYAVRSADLIEARDAGAQTLALELAGESAAGHAHAGTVAPGTCVRIATGAVVPPSADAVVPQEDTTRVASEDGAPGARAQVEFSPEALAQVAPQRWIRASGSDVEAGELLLEAGHSITAGGASLLAAAGHAELALARAPRVAILSSGDELVAIGQTPAPGQVVATNTMLLAAQIREAGGEPVLLGPVSDTHEAMRAAIQDALASADLLVASGGISVGDHDLVLPSLEHFGFELRFRKLALRPGRPTTFGHLPRAPRALPVLALPGNPASTLVTFELFARPAIRALLGLPRARWARRRQRVELAAPVRGEQRRSHFVRARFDEHGRAYPLSTQQSGALRSIASFELLLCVPAGRELVDAGEQLEAIVLPE